MTATEPSQPLTDAELARMDRELTDAYERDGEWYLTTDAPRDMRRLLAEVTRLRSENAAARELHEPAQSSAWNYLYCASGCGAGPLQGPDPWPCNTAKALGIDQSGEGQANA